MAKWLERTERMLGTDAITRLQNARVAVFGIGGVGSYALEALVRAGIGHLLIVDGDTVDVTNINRQLVATQDTIGMDKVAVAAAHAKAINPAVEMDARRLFYSAETADQIDLTGFSYVADCIDSVTSKLLLIAASKRLHVPILSCMGAGNKLDASQFEIADIAHTSVCPLARVMRRELKSRGITDVKVLYSKEEPVVPRDGLHAPGSVSFVPSVAGLLMAGEIIRDLILQKE